MIHFQSLFQIANNQRKNDTFGSVCQSITANLGKFKTYSIMEMADICSVSISTISRLAPYMDYRNFTTMAAQLYDLYDDYIAGGSILRETAPAKETPAAAFAQMRSLLDDIESKMNSNDIRKCVELMQNSKKVIIGGYPHPQSVEALQMELAMQNIASNAFFNPEDQYEELQNVTDDDTVILLDCYLHKTIFSALVEHYNDKGKLIVISCSPSRKRSVSADVYISFPDINFSMNLYSASAILYVLTAALQAADISYLRKR